MLSKKKKEAERVLERLISAELNWIFVTEADLNAIEREVAVGMSAAKAKKDKNIDDEDDSGPKHWSADLAQVVIIGEETSSTSMLFEPGRESKIRELALDAYVRLMLRRVFYAVPMNVRNLLVTEFRKDIVR